MEEEEEEEDFAAVPAARLNYTVKGLLAYQATRQLGSCWSS